jgi:hypothetical protein
MSRELNFSTNSLKAPHSAFPFIEFSTLKNLKATKHQQNQKLCSFTIEASGKTGEELLKKKNFS